MRTLSEEIRDIKNGKGSKTMKKEALIKLGHDRHKTIEFRQHQGSETAFREIIYPLIVRNGLRSRYTKRVINSIRGFSKFAIMQNNSVHLFGDFEQIDGLYYSNTRWLYY